MDDRRAGRPRGPSAAGPSKEADPGRATSSRHFEEPVNCAACAESEDVGVSAGVLAIPRKEVIQPQVLLRLPCYDLVPVTGLTVVASALAVRSATLGTPGSHGLTGGVYKAQEHIHRGIADPRLLAIPASCRRISAYNPN